MEQTARAAAAVTVEEQAVPRFRWAICSLLFFATTVNYIDRQVIGILKPELQKELGWKIGRAHV